MKRPLKLLFICTHNRCRSILCEALTNALADGRIVAASAGSAPAGDLHPRTIETLREAGIPTDGLRCKSWDDMEDFEPDLVVTVCDTAANEACPLWLGPTPKVHWGLADPSKIEGSDDEIKQAFRRTLDEIRLRTERLAALPLETASVEALVAEIRALAAR